MNHAEVFDASLRRASKTTRLFRGHVPHQVKVDFFSDEMYKIFSMS